MRNQLIGAAHVNCAENSSLCAIGARYLGVIVVDPIRTDTKISQALKTSTL
jgi:hypothetical protein